MKSHLKSRVENTVSNFNASIITMIVTNILGFISRTVFIQILDAAYLGINGLYSNLLSMLSLAELGIGTAIVFSLYKPLANRDIETISALMSFYRKAYKIIGCIIAIVGLVLSIFLEKLVADVTSIEHYRLYYLLFLFNTVSTYFLSYKEILVTTDQKAYLLTSRNLVFQIITSVAQLIVLAITKNYVAYLVTQIVVQTLRKIVVNIYINGLYPEIDFNSNHKVPKTKLSEIKKNVSAMFLQKIGGYVVFGTDNILIATFVNLTTVGLYSNYTMIVNIVYSLISTVFSSVGASVGNLTATDKGHEYKIYKTSLFINYLLASFTAICLYLLLNPFISIWIGEEFCLGTATVFVIVLNYYMTAMRKSTEVFYNANGLFWYSRYKSLVEAGINLVVSIVLARKLGILGILIGTSVSSICTSVLYDVYVLFKYGFKKTGDEFLSAYVVNYLKYLILTLVLGVLCGLVLNKIGYSNIVMLCLDGLTCLAIFTIVNYALFRNTDEFKELQKKAMQALKIRMGSRDS